MRAPVLNIRIRKYSMWNNIHVTNFRTRVLFENISTTKKRLITVLLYLSVVMTQNEFNLHFLIKDATTFPHQMTCAKS